MRTPARDLETRNTLSALDQLESTGEALAKVYQGLASVFLDPEATSDQAKVACDKANKVLVAQYKVRDAIASLYAAVNNE